MNRCTRRRAGKGGVGKCAALWAAPDRTELSRCDPPRTRPQRHLHQQFREAGNLALISQSGALCSAILDWASPNDVGFSSVVSLGDSADVDFGEILDFMVSDPKTRAILLYIEGIRNARRFMSALRAAARHKPVLVVKVGRHEAGSKAAQSHTDALVVADDVFDATLRRAGAVRVLSVAQLFTSARALATGMRPSGNRLAIVTNGGGPGVMAADRAADLGVELATLSPQSIEALNAVLPVTWSHGNPVDIIGDATAQRYRDALTICMQDKANDGVLVILTPQAMTQPLQVAEAVIEVARQFTKPLLVSWMGGSQVMEARNALRRGRHFQLSHTGAGGRGVFLPLRVCAQSAIAAADARPAGASGRAGHRRRAPADRERTGRAPQGAQ